MSDMVLDCRKVCKKFADGEGEISVLENIDLQVYAGESVSITGPSGAGKSTLLYCLAGLDEVDAGDISLCGERFSTVGEERRSYLRNKQLGFVYQFHYLLPEFSAVENVAMPLLIAGRNYKKGIEEATFMLDRVGLFSRRNHRPSELSGGERQRVALARALINSPRCVLADEPTGNLDFENAKIVCKLLLELAAENNSAVVIVTHDLDVAAKTGRRLELKQGVLSAVML